LVQQQIKKIYNKDQIQKLFEEENMISFSIDDNANDIKENDLKRQIENIDKSLINLQ
jgi:hypothetical protein